MNQLNMKTVAKRMSLLALSGAFVVGIAACGGGGGSGDSGSSSSTISGNPVKGAYTECTVDITKVVVGGTGKSTVPAETVSLTCDSSGAYKGDVSWSGASVVEVYGKYYDEFTTQPVTTVKGVDTPLRASVKVTPGVAATASPNTLSSASAELLLEQAKAATVDATALDNLVATNDIQIAKLVGGIELKPGESLAGFDLTNTASLSSSTASSAAVALFAANQALLKQANDLGTTISKMVTIAKDAGKNGVNIDKQLQHPDAKASFGTGKAYLAGGFTTNMKALVDAPKKVSSGGAEFFFSDTAKAAAKEAADAAKVTKGIGCVGNQFTAASTGNTTAIFHIDSTGLASLGPTGGQTISNNALTFGCTLADYRNLTGTGSLAFNSAVTPVSFSMKLAGKLPDKRSITANVDKVTLSYSAAAVGSGVTGVTASIPADAKFTFQGTDSLGATVHSTHKVNVAEDSGIITASVTVSGTAITVNASALLSKVTGKVEGTLKDLMSTGSFNFELGFGGMPIGFISGTAATAALNNLYPTGGAVSGNKIHGSITITK